MLVKVNISGLSLDPQTNSPIILLKEENGEKSLPIWIGLLEATAIASELENIKFSRPMTHDLMRDLLEKYGAIVDMIEVSDLVDNTFFATIYTSREGAQAKLDARPSDAIALALRVKAPIFVNDKVFSKSTQLDLGDKRMIKDAGAEKWTDVLEGLDPEDFGKYKM